jgi:hypothetical protein
MLRGDMKDGAGTLVRMPAHAAPLNAETTINVIGETPCRNRLATSTSKEPQLDLAALLAERLIESRPRKGSAISRRMGKVPAMPKRANKSNPKLSILAPLSCTPATQSDSRRLPIEAQLLMRLARELSVRT